MSNQSDLQAAVRDLTLTALTYEGDWHALFDLSGVASGAYNERLRAWINAELGTSYAGLPEALARYAARLGVTRWTDLRSLKQRYYLNAPGAVGDYVSTPDSTSLTPPSSTLDLKVAIAADDYTPATTEAVISQWHGGGQLAFAGRITPAGALDFFVSTTGANAFSAASSVVTGFTDGTDAWLRWLINVPASTCNFFTSTDPITTSPGDVSWTHLGTADRAFSSNISAGIHNSTDGIDLSGIGSGGSQLYNGRIYRAAGVYDGTTQFDFSASRYTGQGSTVAGGEGETWTANGNTSFVQVT